jgi:nucleoside-diphosphate-sugar epimerase
MRVFVAGATGVPGKRIVAECTERGYDVFGLTRDEHGDDIVADRGGTPVRGDILDQTTLGEPVQDADVVVHTAT